jgi:translation initiation factor 1
MPRPEPKRVETRGPAQPLFADAFAALGSLDSSQLAAAPVPPPVVAEPVPATPPKKSRGRLVLRRETKERGGKTVVVITGFVELGYNAAQMADLSRLLKNKLGVGGSFDRTEIIVQGDQPAKVCSLLEAEGYRVDGVRS